MPFLLNSTNLTQLHSTLLLQQLQLLRLLLLLLLLHLPFFLPLTVLFPSYSSLEWCSWATQVDNSSNQQKERKRERENTQTLTHPPPTQGRRKRNDATNNDYPFTYPESRKLFFHLPSMSMTIEASNHTQTKAHIGATKYSLTVLTLSSIFTATATDAKGRWTHQQVYRWQCDI